MCNTTRRMIYSRSSKKLKNTYKKAKGQASTRRNTNQDTGTKKANPISVVKWEKEDLANVREVASIQKNNKEVECYIAKDIRAVDGLGTQRRKAYKGIGKVYKFHAGVRHHGIRPHVAMHDPHGGGDGSTPPRGGDDGKKGGKR